MEEHFGLMRQHVRNTEVEKSLTQAEWLPWLKYRWTSLVQGLLGVRLHSGRCVVDKLLTYHKVIIKLKCTISVMCWNHLETTPHSIRENTAFQQTDPWCQKGWGPLN